MTSGSVMSNRLMVCLKLFRSLCDIADIGKDSNGVLIQKEVRFRIEFTPAPNSSSTVPNNMSTKNGLPHSKSSKAQASVGYVTRVGFVLERGAASALKAVYTRMRDEWR